MQTRFQVGDIINYNTPDKSFSYCNGNYLVLKTKVSRFSDNNEEFQDLECKGVEWEDGTTCHFMDGAETPNPYLSLVR